MFQHLDDPVPLPPASSDQIRSDMDRGTDLRRRRRALVAIPLGAVVLGAAVAAFFLALAGPATTTEPAAPPAQSSPVSTVSGVPNTAEPAYSACPDPVGDTVEDPDLALVALDRPAFPFIHYHWGGSSLPSSGTVDALFTATSADGQRSRQLVVVVIGGDVMSQSVLDPATGRRQSLDPGALTDTSVGGVRQRAVELTADGLGATFPASAFMPLGQGWNWTASIAVDGRVVDVCDGPMVR
jgi:hypothetical protein